MPGFFDQQDVALLERFLGYYPDHLVVAVAAKRAEASQVYPVENGAALKTLLQGDSERFGKQVVEKADIDRYVPTAFYPIVDEADLVRKLAIALQRGAIHHYLQDVTAHVAHGEVASGTGVPDVMLSPTLPTSLRYFEQFLG